MNKILMAARARESRAPARNDPENAAAVAQIGARIDALNGSMRLWGWVALIAVGGFFEIYDLALTAPLSPGLVAAGIFKTGNAGLFGFSDQATFIAATFLGLYVGVIGFAGLGDRFGRKAVFGYALASYALATFVMGLQNDSIWVCFWRFLAGVGLGAESVAIDCFIVEIMPRHLRGKAFGMGKSIEYSAIPIAALLAAVLVPRSILGITGWRWLTFLPAVGAAAFWIFRRNLPESPRWLASQGRREEAHAVLDAFDAGEPPGMQPAPVVSAPTGPRTAHRTSPRYVRNAMLMMIVYFVFQNIAYYGFSNWIPTLLEAQGVPLQHSLFYTFGVSLAAPLGPILVALLADRFERKHQIIVIGLVAIVLGVVFAHSVSPIGWISTGIGLTFANAALSFHGHAYQSEIFPTSIRARAVGFVYSFTRLSAAISGYIVAFALTRGGVATVFLTISGCMLVAVLTIGLAGPRTRNRTFEEITGQP
ncbi:MFS transporter [Burkholderia pseudomultivorans]|uniref:MFS transporter n=1 Tax=Burkholderia pseudomultivorans TaxID=1207504 RepID=UPI0028741FC4|nr:MFS transporter [Burkholderia pseudomultivorans]MDS0862721.1 MFS transporter [Burkholderia pseudomultivorans]